MARAVQARSERFTARDERFRLSSQVVGLIGLITLLVVAPALWIVDSLVRERLLQRAVEDLRRTDSEWLANLQDALVQAEDSVQRFAHLLAVHQRAPRPEDEGDFAAEVVRDPDGLWRSRAGVFDGLHHAGIWAPDTAVADPRERSFFLQTRRLTELYGQGARGGLFANTWVLPASNGEIVFWPGQPDFIRDASATQDYRPTEWFQLVTPENNPEGFPRWTTTSFDPVPRQWMISVVAPFRREDRWAGAVGHDLIVGDLLGRMQPVLTYPNSQIVLVDDHGRVLIASGHQDVIEASAGQARLADLKDGPLASAFQAAQARLRRSRASCVLLESRHNLLFAGQLEGPGWTVLHMVPQAAVVELVEAPFQWLRWGALGCFLLVIGASGALVTRDTVRRLEAERASRASDEITRALLESTPDAAMLLDPSGRVLAANPAAARALNRPEAQLLGCDVFTCLPPAVAARRKLWLEEVVRTGRPLRREDDNRGRHLDTVLHPVLDPRGGVLRVGVFARDITELVQADLDRQRLEQRVMQAQKLESLGVLAGGIAHDFNNLLQAILGHADLALEEAAPDSPLAASLQEIRAAGQRAAAISRQMLAYSGRGSIARDDTSVAAVLRELLPTLRATVPAHIRLQERLAGELPPVHMDIALFRQVVTNLITNAAEAIDGRDGEIVLSTGSGPWTRDELRTLVGEPEIPEGTYVHVEIADNGQGMDAATMERMFDPFFSTKFTGRGLGLPVAQGFVHAHQGGIRVRSRPGEGTTITLVLPASGATPPALPFPAAPPDWRGEGRVLLVDDEHTVRVLGRRLLELMGFQVVTAADGIEALAALRAGPGDFRAVLLDLVMPRMAGDETLASIRREHPALPVLVISGYARAEVEARLRGQHPSAILQKPFGRAALAAALCAILTPVRGAVKTL